MKKSVDLSGYYWMIPVAAVVGVTVVLMGGAFRNSVSDPYAKSYIEDFEHQQNFKIFCEESLLTDDGAGGVRADWERFYAYVKTNYNLGRMVAEAERRLATGESPADESSPFKGQWNRLRAMGVVHIDDRGKAYIDGEAFHKRALKTTFGRHFLTAAHNVHRFRLGEDGQVRADDFYFRETNVFSVTRVLPRGSIYDRHDREIVGWSRGRRDYQNASPGVFHIVGLPNRFGLEARMDEALSPKPDRGLHDMLGLYGRDRRGDDLQLSIDGPLSETLYNAFDFPKGRKAGAAVVLEVGTGRILAAVSSNAPNPAEWRAKMDELMRDPDRPLLNRCWDELYFPGSTYKTVVAASMLEHKEMVGPFRVREKAEFLKIRNNRNKVRKHPIDLISAYAYSSNTYFAEKGVLLGQRTKETAERFGFNRPIELLANVEDAKPWTAVAPVAYRGGQRFRFRKRGDQRLVAQFSIGQNQIKSHALHMAGVMATIAQDGVWINPTMIQGRREGALAREEENTRPFESLPTGKTRRIIATDDATKLRQAAWATMNRSGGTGYAGEQIYREETEAGIVYVIARRNQLPREQLVPSAGKTGTAEHGQKKKPAHSWYIGYAPADNPKVAVAVVVEYAGYGSTYAMPIAMKAMAGALQSLETPPEQADF